MAHYMGKYHRFVLIIIIGLDLAVIDSSSTAA